MEKPFFITPQSLAPFYKRLFNLFIDMVLVSFIVAILILIGNALADGYGYSSLKTNLEQPDNYRTRLLLSAVWLTYYGLFESYLQRTPGKFITGTRVIRMDGTQPTEWNILLRSALRQIPFEFLSFIGLVPVGLHDMLSKTLVIDVAKFNNGIGRQQRERNKTSEN